MNWKEFLKPDWDKILLSIIFMFIFLSSPIFAKVPVWISVIFDFFRIPLIVLDLAFSVLKVGLIGLLVVPFLLLYWYLLSCLIVWIYDKVKKK